MTIELQTLKDGKLILAKESQTMTLAELTQFYDAVYSACDQSATPCCSIIDIANSTRFPPNVLSSAGINHPHFPTKHPNFGLGVVVGTNSFTRSIADIGIKVANIKAIRVATSLAAAMEMVEAFLAEHRVLPGNPT